MKIETMEIDTLDRSGLFVAAAAIFMQLKSFSALVHHFLVLSLQKQVYSPSRIAAISNPMLCSVTKVMRDWSQATEADDNTTLQFTP